jgi:ABC-type uncharacterized transport system permease subunit
MMAALPSAVLYRRGEDPFALGLAFLASLAFIAIAVRIFSLALRRYQSVNSGV